MDQNTQQAHNQPAQVDQNTIASMTDSELVELGLTREQAESFDRIIARQAQEAREMQDFLDSMRDSN